MVTTVPENIPTVSDLGMYAEIIIVANTMLNNCPVNLIVPKNPDAVPELSRETDPITEFVFGAEKRPNPMPIVPRRSNMIAL